MEAVAEADHVVEAKRVDDFDGEFFGADVAQAHGRIALFDGVPNGVHQVSFAHAHSAVEEKRVVGLRGLLGHGARCRMRKFVGLADDKGVEGIAVVELMVAVVEIELGLLDAGCRGSRLNRFFFGADVLHLGGGRTKLMEDRFDDVAVGASQDLAENRAGNLDVEGIALGVIQASGLKPGTEDIDANARLNPLKKPFPNVGRSRHRKRKADPTLFPQM